MSCTGFDIIDCQWAPKLEVVEYFCTIRRAVVQTTLEEYLLVFFITYFLVAWSTGIYWNINYVKEQGDQALALWLKEKKGEQ